LDIFKSYATDDSLETAGVWQNLGDAKFLIARNPNRNYARRLNAQLEAHRVALDAETPEAYALDNRIMAEVYAETILLGWENVVYNGHKFAYTKENAIKALTHRDFRVEIGRLASNVEAYRLKQEAEQVKN
jgi:hypothetical protein